MEIKGLLFEGTTKKVYATDQNDEVLIEFQDRLPRWVSGKKSTVKGKAQENNVISSFIFEYLESYNVPTHFIRKLDDKSFLARRLEMIPLTVTIWNVASKELARRFGLEAGKILECPIVEMHLKDEKLKMPMINEYHAFALGICDRNEINSVLRISTKINAVLKSFFERKRMKLINFNLEFGRSHNQILLGDELSPDTLVLWEIDEKGSFTNQKKLDISGANPLSIYQELRQRITAGK